MLVNTSEENTKTANWAGNLIYGTDRIYYPETVEAVQALVKKLDKVKPLGTRHCFNHIADSADNLVTLTEMNKVVELDKEAKTVTVEAGIKYGVLAPYLHARGFALHNLASLPHISVAGSVATGTHGSGVGNGSLATAVTALELVTADGSVVKLSRSANPEHFHAAVVGLGAFGVVTKITLEVEPTYMMRQKVYVGLPIDRLKDNFEQIIPRATALACSPTGSHKVLPRRGSKTGSTWSI